MRRRNKYDRILFHTRYKLTLYGPDGKVKETREGKNTFTEGGDAIVADSLSDRALTRPTHFAVGSGSGGGASSTALVSELGRAALTATTLGTGANDNDVVYTASLGPGVGTGAITEGGLFNAAVAGTLFNYLAISTLTKNAADTLGISLTVTFGAS